MDEQLAGKEYLLGDFSIADAALFYVEFWAGRLGIDLPPNCAAHFARMKARPAVRRAMETEGVAGMSDSSLGSPMPIAPGSALVISGSPYFQFEQAWQSCA